jgi:adenine-specific DNA-methyltransferase
MKEGARDWLLTPTNGQSRAVRNLLKRKAAKEARSSYKCDIRTPWWRVPLSDPPRALMVYMGSKARIVSNTARAQVSNSFFRLTEIKGLSANDLAVASLTSVFRLSGRLNSRLLGGGLLKLEPSDARNVLVPMHRTRARDVARVDRLLRLGRLDHAQALADRLILKRGLGWSEKFIESVRAAAEQVH